MAKIDITISGSDKASPANKSATKSSQELQQATLDLKKAQIDLKEAQLDNVQAATKLKQAQLDNVQAAIKSKELADQLRQSNASLSATLKTDVANATIDVKNAQVANYEASIKSKDANDQLKAKLSDARIQSMQFKDQLAGLKAAHELAKKATDDTSQAESKLDSITAGLKSTLTSFGDAAKSAAGKITDFGKKAASAAVDGVGKLASLTADAAIGVAKFGLAAGAAATAAGGGALKLAADYEDAFAQVKVATSVQERTTENYKAMEDAAVRVGIQTKFSAKEAMLGLSELEQQGLNVKQSIQALDSVAQAASINNVSMAESSTVMATAMNAFGLSADQTTHILDVQTKAAQMGVMGFQDFKLALAAGGSVAQLANQSFEGTTAELLALTNTGQSASDSGTSLKAALLQLVSPGQQASAAIDALGLSVRDQSGEVRPFVDIIAQIEKNTKNMTKEQRDFYLANLGGSDGIRAYSAALQAKVQVERDGKIVTLQGSEALRYYQQQLDESGGTAQKAADIIQSTLSAKVENLKGSIEQLGITVGTALIPTAKTVVDTLTGVVNKALEWEEKNHGISNTIQEVTGKVGDFGDKLMGLYDKVSPFLSLLNPLKLGLEVVAGVMSGGLAGGIKVLENEVVGIGKAFGVDLTPQMKGVDDFIKTHIVPTFNTVAKFIGTEVIPRVVSFGKTFITDVLPKVGDALGWIGDKFGGFVDILSRDVFPIAEKVFSWLGDKGSQLFNSVSDTLSTRVFPAIESLGKWVGDWLWPKLQDVFDWIGKNVGPIFDKGFGILTEHVIPTIGDLVNVVLTKVVPTLGSWIDVIGTGLSPILESVGGFINDTLLPNIGKIWDVIDKNVIPAFSGLCDVMDKNVLPILKGVAGFLGGTVGVVFNVVGGIIGGVIEVVGRLGGAVAAVARGDWGGALDAITGKTVGLKESVGDLQSKNDDMFRQLNSVGNPSVSNQTKAVNDLNTKTQDTKKSTDDFQKAQDALNKKFNDESAKAWNDATEKAKDLKKQYDDGKISGDEYKQKVDEINKKLKDFNDLQVKKKDFTANFPEFMASLGKVAGQLADISKIKVPGWTFYSAPAPIQDYPETNGVGVNFGPGWKNGEGPVFQHATGTPFHVGGPAELAEDGRPEVVSVNGRKYRVNQPTFVLDLQRGASVTSNQNLSQSDRSGGAPVPQVVNHNYYYNVTGTFQAEEPEDLVTKLKLTQMGSPRM